MRILVLAKHVPDTTEIRFSPAGELMVRQAPTKVNDYDRHALEEASRLRESGAEVVIGSVGPAEAAKTMKEALAYGADRAVLASGAWVGDADPEAMAEVLAAIARREGLFDLVLGGDVSEDGYNALVPGLLAAKLGAPYVRGATALDVSGSTAKVTRLLGEVEEELEVALPAVVSVTRLLNSPRVISTMAVMKVPMSKVETVDLGQLGLDPAAFAPEGLATRVAAVRPVQSKRGNEMLRGEPADVAAELAAKLRGMGVL